MPYRIAKRFVIESGHLLSKHPGACRFPHGHSRTVELVLIAPRLDVCDMVCDFKAVALAASAAVNRFDHAFALNSSDPQFATLRATYGERVIAFENCDPTSEVLAREIFRAVRTAILAVPTCGENAIRPEVRLERVRVTETATSWAEYWE